MCSKSQGFYGEPARIRESEIEDYLVKRVKELGGEARKLKWIGHRGAPDRFVMVFGRSFFVELKALGKKPSKQQDKEFALLRKSGVRVYTADTFIAVEALLHLESVLARK